jgi:hypothetical protein
MAQNNIEILAQTNKMIQQQNKLYEVQGKMLKAQFETTKAMVKVLSSMPGKEISENFKTAEAAVKDAEKAIERMSDTTKNLGEKAKNASKEFGGAGDNILKMVNYGTKFSIVKMSIDAAIGSFKVMGGVIGGLVDTFMTLGSVLFDIGLSIISAPFKWLSSLISGAGAGGSGEFATAINNVRKEFGQLATNEAKDVMDAFKGIRGDLAETGISSFRILGNLAQRLQYVTELAQKMGPAWTSIGKQIKNGLDVERMAAYQKGLGLTDEGIKGLGDRSIAAGKSFNELGREITTYAYQIGPAFGINGKIISRAVGNMMADVKNFGNLTIKQMSQAAVYTRKLGIEIKALQGLIDKFDNFEDAAEGAAQLSQAFGLNIDALEMMKEQDPAKRLEILRSEFSKTGKDVMALTRQERALLSAQTGLADEDLVKAFSKQAMSYDEITKAGDKAEKKQLSQAQAMDKLAMSIERLVQGGGGMSGFLDAFVQGIERGIRFSGPFREMFIAVRRAMQATRMAGMEVGRTIVESWPGIKEVFSGVRDFFKNFGSLTEKGKASGFIKSFANTLKDFIKNPSIGLQGFINNLNDRLGPLFSLNGPIMKKLIDGAKNSFKHLMEIMAQIIKFGLESVTELFKSGSGFLKALRTGNWNELFSGAQSGFMKFIGEVFKPIVDVFKDEKLLSGLKNAFFGFAEEAWNTLSDAFEKFFWPKVKKFWDDNWIKISLISAGLFFGPAIIGILIATATAALSQVAGAIISFGAPLLKSAFAKIIPTKNDWLDSLNEAMDKSGKTGKKISGLNLKQMSIDMAKFTGYLIVVGAASAALIYLMKKYPPNLTVEEVAAPLLVLTAVATAMLPMSLAMKALENVKLSPSMLGSLALGFGALSLTLPVMIGVFRLIDLMLTGINMTDIVKSGAAIGMMAMAYASAVGVIVASGLIGLLGMLGGAPAMAVGFGVLSITVGLMTKHAISMIEDIDKLKVSESFFTKAKAFGMVTEFFVSVAEIALGFINSSTISTLDLIASFFGKNPKESLDQKLKSIQGFFDSLTTNMMLLITTINNNSQRIDVSKVSAIGSILESFTTMIQTIVPVGEILKDTKKIEPILTAMQSHVHVIVDLMTIDLFPAIRELILSVTRDIKDVKPESIEQFSKIFGMITSLFSVLTPSPELIKSFTEFQNTKGADGEIYQKGAIDIEAMQMGMTTLGASFKTLLSGAIGETGWLTSITSFAISVGDSFKGKNIKSISSSMSIISDTINMVKDMIKVFSDNKNIPSIDPTVVDTFFNKLNEPTIAAIGSHIEQTNTNLEHYLPQKQLENTERIKGVISGFVKAINEQAQLLSNLATTTEPINVKLEKIGDKLGIKDKSEFKIQRGELNVTVNLNVSLDVDELETALSGRGKIAIVQDKK